MLLSPEIGSFPPLLSPPDPCHSRPVPIPVPWHLRGFRDTKGHDFPGSVDPSDQKKTACYDIDVEVEEPLKGQMSSFLLSTANQQEISALDSKVGPKARAGAGQETAEARASWEQIRAGVSFGSPYLRE